MLMIIALSLMIITLTRVIFREKFINLTYTTIFKNILL